MDGYKLFHDSAEINEWVNQYYTKEEVDIFRIGDNVHIGFVLYKGNGSRSINSSIRENRYNPYVDELQELLYTSEIRDNIQVVRFVDKREQRILHKATRWGKLFCYPGFLSTTMLEKQYAMDEVRSGRVPITIYIPKGTPGAYLPEVNSSLPEYEILLPHGMILKRVKKGSYLVMNSQDAYFAHST